MAHALEGLDTLVFTGRVGEHSAMARSAICDRLRWLGVSIDPARNEAGAETIGDSQSAVAVFVIGTDGEAVIAAHCRAVLSRDDGS